jgi:demethylmenaquinone methyltransferase/2-methoxy-6-polyprenyl-1,4-benzoquinol methylase
VLEVATGTGYWTRFIAPVASHVVALDSSIETISIARTPAAKRKVSFLVGDAYSIPLVFTTWQY